MIQTTISTALSDVVLSHVKAGDNNSLPLFLVNAGNVVILAQGVRNYYTRMEQLERIVCYTESGTPMPDDLRVIQRECFDRYPFGSLPGEKG